MNADKARQWTSRAMDGELSSRRKQKLNRWLEAHPEEQGLMHQWRQAAICLRTTVSNSPSPDTPERAWAVIRAQLPASPATPWGWWRPGSARLAWSAAFAAAAFLAMVAWWQARGPILPSVAIAAEDQTEVEWVESDVAGAMPVVYTDADTGLTVIWVSFDDERGEADPHAG